MRNTASFISYKARLDPWLNSSAANTSTAPAPCNAKTLFLAPEYAKIKQGFATAPCYAHFACVGSLLDILRIVWIKEIAITTHPKATTAIATYVFELRLLSLM